MACFILGRKTTGINGRPGICIFGVGVEIAGITVSKIIVKWFKGKELALAMGLEMATARLGTSTGPVHFGSHCQGFSQFQCQFLLPGYAVHWIDSILYLYGMDKKLDASVAL